MKEIRPLQGLISMLKTLFWIHIATVMAIYLVDLFDYFSSSGLPPGIDLNETLTASDYLIFFLGLGQFSAFLLLSITFLTWKYWLNRNLHSIGEYHMMFTPGWAVGWYFIPFANLYKPFEVMKELWQASHGEETAEGSILGWWWLLWITSNIFGAIEMNLAFAGDQLAVAKVSILSGFVELALNLVALNLVSQISDAYTRNFVEL